MREYSIVRPEFWTGETGRTLRAYPAEARELAFYLFSCPNNEQYGLYYKPLGVMVEEVGRELKPVRESLILLASLGYCSYDPVNGWVWVHEMAQIQMGLPLKGADYRVRAANRWYQTMPKNAYLGPFFDRYCDALRIEPPRREWEGPPSPTKTVSASQDRKTEAPVVSEGPGQTPLISISPSVLVLEEGGTGGEPEARTVHSERFDRFWDAYPKKVGKKIARMEWDKLKPGDELTAKILAAIERHKRSMRWLRDNGTAIPDPCRYLKYERWNDNYEEGPGLSKQTIGNMQAAGDFLKGFRT
jgi:hypothetical protein